jgi:predicted transcriptional regulator
MSMTVTIPNEISERLHAWARAAKEPEEEVVRRALEAYLSIPPDLREELEAWQDLGAEALEKVAPAVGADANMRP